MRLCKSLIFPAYILVLVLAVMAGTISAGAQDPSASNNEATPGKKKLAPYALIFGTVWDAQNHPAYGVPIKIRRIDQKKAKWEAMSDHRGEFAQRVPAGKADYIIYADIKPPKGKKDWQRPETKAHIENEERTDVALHLTE